ncbi:MAG: polysaccharide deacetylase family protein [Nitrosomonas sp.]|nr:polysaccharide deacetylase family protein [Nitrosomonas sp.]
MKLLPSIFSPAGKRAKLSIVIYHRVLLEPDLLLGQKGDITSFDKHLRILSQNFNIVPLSQAVSMLKTNILPSRAVCITFDDGYADNAEIALPILKKYSAVATFFVSAGVIDGGRMWNDTIIESIRHAQGDILDLTQLGMGNHSIKSLAERQKVLILLIEKLKYMPQEQRQEIVDKLSALIAAKLPDDLMMTSDQVRQLHREGMEIGAHTISHPILARIENPIAYNEIAEGKKMLEEIIKAPVNLFAYPNGKPNKDYQLDHVKMVKEIGFDAAVSTAWGAAQSDDNIYQLPRFTPWDVNEGSFVLRMTRNMFQKIEVAY